MKQIPLKVRESFPEDTGKNVGRISRHIIKEVGLKEGDTIYLENVFVRGWNNKKQLTLGRNGKINKVN